MMFLPPFLFFVWVAWVTLRQAERHSRWREVPRQPIPGDRGEFAYRAGGATVPTFDARTPSAIRWAAFTSILLGQMFVPGFLCAVVGYAFGGVGVVSIPGLIAAAFLWDVGRALARRAPGALAKARRAVRLVVWLNGIIMSASVVALALMPDSWRHDCILWVTFLDVYGVISLSQALFLGWAARRHKNDLEYECAVSERSYS